MDLGIDLCRAEGFVAEHGLGRLESELFPDFGCGGMA